MPDDGMRHELVRGELTTMTPAGSFHGAIASLIDRHLGNHVAAHDLGQTFTADAGFTLQRGPDTVRAPDVAFVRKERFRRERSFYPGAPDLAIGDVVPGWKLPFREIFA